MSEVKIVKGESLERAMKRLSKKIDRENTMDEMRKRRYYEKPSVARKIKKQTIKK